MSLLKKSINYKSVDIPYESSVSCKAILSLLIVLHHICLTVNDLPIFLIPFKYIGFVIVSCFFFFSGYGLHYGYLKKESSYWDGFFKRRFSRVVVPYVCLVIIWIPISLIINKLGWRGYYREIFTLKLIPQMWYIWVLAVAYFLYFLCYRYLRRKMAFAFLIILTVCYIILSVFINAQREFMFSSIMGFTTGIFYATYRDKICSLFNKKFKLKITSFLSLAVLLFVLRLVVKYLGTDSILLHAIWRNVISIMFPIILAQLLTHVNFDSTHLERCGKYSYEIYLTHPFIIYAISRCLNLSNIQFFCVVILLTAFSALILNHISRSINNYIK